ncbi:CBS domain-containing protein [Actinomadura barringtoniae]|uniref:CBS domain-containing protein n=1 Tax=Actinomadura barringtoniae TaxID=1427535 RepID=A0A939TDC6_9ACTN|nr:CBS domain-containing protein [Actinomadura barringtoniae]MBO2455452.1 CBS domain-containing protein [Actinomadura barringtoniae]
MNALPALEERTVADVMATDLLTVTPDDSILMAWELMGRARVDHLPVLTEDAEFMGVIDAQTIAANWEPTGPERARRPVRSLLRAGVGATANPADAIPEAARTMLESGCDYVAVLIDGRALVGLLTAHDLISALAGLPPERTTRPGTSMPSMYRIEPVLPPESRHPGHSMLPPD